MTPRVFVPTCSLKSLGHIAGLLILAAVAAGCASTYASRPVRSTYSPRLTSFARNARPHLDTSTVPATVPGASIAVQIPLVVFWSGALTGSQPSNPLQEMPRTVTTTSGPLVTVFMRNETSSVETVSYQLLITSGGLPFTLGGDPTVLPNAWTHVIWNSQRALPEGTTAISLQPGQTASASMEWPSDLVSSRLGTYYGVVYFSVNGSLWGKPDPFFYYEPLILK